jgi:protein involved in polysaccharide export with SLBB domain
MISRPAAFIILSAIMLALAGCFSSNPKNIKAFKMPSEVNTTTDTYILQPPDEVQAVCSKVAGGKIAGINGVRQTIRPDGKISFEDIGEIVAAGKTPKEVADVLREKIIEYYEFTGDHPVDVQIVAYRSKVYYVLGQVNAPGPRIYTGRDSFLTAIAQAQPNPMAWIERIQVIRPSPDKRVNPKIFEVNFDRMMAHGDTTKNVLLQEGDILYVPPTILGWIGLKIEEIIRPIARAFTGYYIVQNGGQQSYGGY